MNEQPKDPQPMTPIVDRRRWMKQTAAIVGGAAAASLPGAPAIAARAEDAQQSSSTATQGAGVHVLTPDAGVVETTAGKVRGFTRNGVFIFRGIPYGDTTAGENRFRPAKKPQPWTGVRSST